MQRAKSVDEYVENASVWGDELRRLREILKTTPLDEEVKWGGPCYTWKGKNVVGVGAFKSYFGLWFHQGALLSDDAGVLINAQEGKTRALPKIWEAGSEVGKASKAYKAAVAELAKVAGGGLDGLKVAVGALGAVSGTNVRAAGAVRNRAYALADRVRRGVASVAGSRYVEWA